MLLQVLFSLLAIFAGKIFWRRWKYDLHKIPSPPGLPVVGHTLNILSNRGEGELYRYIGNAWRALGQPNLFKLSLGGKTILMLREIEAARNLMASKAIPIKRPASIPAFMTPLTGDDLTAKALLKIVEITPYVRAVRKVYANGLQSMTLKPALPKLQRVMDRLMEIIDDRRKGGAVNVQDLCIKTTLDTIGVLAFDTNLGGLDGSRHIDRLIIETGHICIHRQHSFIETRLYKLMPFLKGAREQQKTVDALTAEWVKLADEMFAREDPPAGEQPIWYCLKTLIDPETGKGLEYKSVLAEMATVVLGGMDATGHQLACILALLGSYPHVMDKIVAELKEHGHDESGCRDLTLEDLNSLVYIAAVVKEGLRISHVTAPSRGRQLCKDATILGYRIPKGSTVMIPPLRWMNSKTDWGDPDVFRPERWLTDEDLTQKFYIPFACGPRDCIGQKLSVLEMRLALARLVQRYKFSSVRPVEEVLKDSRTGLVIEAADGVWLNIEPRN